MNAKDSRTVSPILLSTSGRRLALTQTLKTVPYWCWHKWTKLSQVTSRHVLRCLIQSSQACWVIGGSSRTLFSGKCAAVTAAYANLNARYFKSLVLVKVMRAVDSTTSTDLCAQSGSTNLPENNGTISSLCVCFNVITKRFKKFNLFAHQALVFGE
jgi:hypothetical protein